MKEKIIKYLIIIFSILIISLGIGYIITACYLIPKNNGVDFSFAKMINNFKADKFNVLIFFGTSLCIFALISTNILSKTSKIYKTDMVKITDDISIPKPCGNSQYGCAFFTTEKEQDKIFSKIVLDKENIYNSLTETGVPIALKSFGNKEKIYLIKYIELYILI